MIFLGHIGLGLKMTRFFPQTRPPALPLGWVALGTLLPDLLDKSLYYSLSWFTGLKGLELGLVSGTRTFAHTALFLILLGGLGWLCRSKKYSKIIWALFFGIATHVFLDHLGDSIGYAIWPVESPENARLSAYRSMQGLLWPLLGAQFPGASFSNLKDHLGSVMRPHLFLGELFGLILILTDRHLRGQLRRDMHYEVIERLWKRVYSPCKSKSSS